MKTLVWSLVVLVVVLGALNATAAGDLTWQELVRRPELWPAQCTSKVTIPFDGGVSIKAGQKLKVLKVLPNAVQVTTLDDKVTFEAEPDETDMLAVARDAYAKLTPKQQALTYATIAQRKGLWPERVTATRQFSLSPTQTIQAGDVLLLVNCQPAGLTVKSEKFNATFNVVADATDIMVLARKLVEDPQAMPTRAAAEEKQKAIGRIFAETEGKLINSVTGKPDPLDAKAVPKYYVFFRGSSTCPITRQFTPTVVKFYNDTKPKHPEFEIIWLMTEKIDDTAKFAKANGFAWRAMEYGSTPAIPTVHQAISGRLPQLIVVDRNGKVLANGTQNQAPVALKQLDALLKQPAEQK
jgi:hypothetical protein